MKRICSCNWEGTANRNLPRVLRLNKTPFFKANSDFSFWLGDITISASRMIGQRWRFNFCRKFSSFGRNLFWSLTKSDTTWRSVSHPPGPERDASGLRERASATEFKLPLMWLIQRSNSCKNKIHWANVPVNSLFSYKYFTAELSVQTVNFEPYTNGLNFLKGPYKSQTFQLIWRVSTFTRRQTSAKKCDRAKPFTWILREQHSVQTNWRPLEFRCPGTRCSVLGREPYTTCRSKSLPFCPYQREWRTT